MQTNVPQGLHFCQLSTATTSWSSRRTTLTSALRTDFDFDHQLSQPIATMAEDNALLANLDLDAIRRTLAGLPKLEEQQEQQEQLQLQDPHLPQQQPIPDPRLVGRSLQPQSTP